MAPRGKLAQPRLASVQQHYIRAREILGDVLCLDAPLSPTKRAYCAVLAVAPLNFLLKAADEQEALIARYHRLLKALSFPIQLVVRNERLDLRPYLARVQAQVPVVAPAEAASSTTPGDPPPRPGQAIAPLVGDEAARAPRWAMLAADLATLLRQIGSRRTLLERHCYLVVPAPTLAPATRRFSPRPARRRARQEVLVNRAVQDLAVRVEMVQAQLAALGLRSHRLAGEDLARVYHGFLSPQRALQHPLQHTHLAAIGHFPQVQWRTPVGKSGREAVSVPTAEEAEEHAEEAPEASRTTPRAQHAPAGPGTRGPGARRRRDLPPPDYVRLADLLVPASLTEEWDALRVDEEWVRTLVVIAFPREVYTSGWLAPLLLLDEVLDICFHLHPQNQAAMMRLLKRRRVGYASARAFQRRQGQLDDPDLHVAQEDVARLMSELASGSERLFELSLLILVRAASKAALDERCERLLALLQTIFLDAVAHPATFEHGPAFRSCLPEARDELGRTITLDATSIATTFPFLSNALTMPGGTFLGLTGTGEPVLLDPWDSTLENPHAYLGGVTGAGKSFLGKLWIARGLLINGTSERIAVIDPDGEYGRLAEPLGGTIVHLAAGSKQTLNPFDLLPPGCDFATYLANVQRIDRLAEKVQDLLSFLDLLLADHGTVLGTREKALLDRALYEVYRRVGISPDPRTHYHPPPLLRDLADVLKSGVCGQDEFDLGLRLSRYVDGSLAGLFARQTSVALDSHLLVWDVRDMRGDLRPIGIFLIADCIWTQAIYQSRVRRALYIDEAASLIEHAEGGKFLANLSRRARKRYLRLVVMTQNPEAFVLDEWGSVVAANAAIKILKKQDRTSVKAVASRFGLTDGEAQRLLTFGVQEALLFAGDRRVLLSVQASAQEHALIMTNPVELAAQFHQEQAVLAQTVLDAPEAQKETHA